MPIKLPPLTAKPAVLADWVELRTLCDPDSYFRLGALKRFWDTSREREDSDPVGEEMVEANTDEDGVSGPDADAFLDAIVDELGKRARLLGAAYPFRFSDDGFRLQVEFNLTYGGWCYLFCLFLSHSKTDEILSGEWLPDIDIYVRDLFQMCSSVAAAGKVNGCSISFGPTPYGGGLAFLPRLQYVYKLFGEGVPVKSVPIGATPFAKDEEIDVIAWTPRPDGPGTLYLLGQVASGHNWEGKSLKGGIDYFHRTWFSRPPASNPQPCIFIPHLIASIQDGTREDAMDLLTAKYGMILDRLSVPRLALEGIELSELNDALVIERLQEMPDVVHWVTAEVTYMRLAGESPL